MCVAGGGGGDGRGGAMVEGGSLAARGSCGLKDVQGCGLRGMK